MSLGAKIKELREAKRISIRGLGRNTDVSGMHISNIEKDKVNASPELVTKIAEALEADIDELLHLANRVDPEVVVLAAVFFAKLLKAVHKVVK